MANLLARHAEGILPRFPRRWRHIFDCDRVSGEVIRRFTAVSTEYRPVSQMNLDVADILVTGNARHAAPQSVENRTIFVFRQADTPWRNTSPGVAPVK